MHKSGEFFGWVGGELGNGSIMLIIEWQDSNVAVFTHTILVRSMTVGVKNCRTVPYGDPSTVRRRLAHADYCMFLDTMANRIADVATVSLRELPSDDGALSLGFCRTPPTDFG